MQLGFYVDTSRCMSCHACEVACKQAHDVELGTAWRQVTEIWGGTFPDVSRTFVSLACMHCGNPACEAVCPTGAIRKDSDTGIVTVDQNKCIGCHYCFFACPFGVPQYGSEGTMQKCDLCIDRLEAGGKPACVSACLGGALHFGTLEELSKLTRAKAARQLVASTQPSVLISR